MSAEDTAAKYLDAVQGMANGWDRKYSAAERLMSLGILPTAQVLLATARGTYYGLRLRREAFGPGGLSPLLQGELADDSTKSLAEAVLGMSEVSCDLMAELETGPTQL